MPTPSSSTTTAWWTPSATSGEAVDGRAGGGAQLGGGRAPAKIGRERLAGGQHVLDGAHQQAGGGRLAQEVEHQLQRPEVADRVGDALADDVGGGAVDGLEQAGVAALGVEVGAGGQAHAAGD